MNRTIRSGLTLIALLLILASCTSTVKEIKPKSDFKVVDSVDEIIDLSVINNVNKSGYDVFNAIYLEKPNENLLFSPLSLTCALSMLENGAAGETSREILDVLHLESNTNMNTTYNGMINHFNNLTKENQTEDQPTTTLNMSNSFWFKNQGLKIDNDYIDLIKSYYDGEVQAVDFSDAKTKDAMNQWIEEKTNHLLKDTIKDIKTEDVAFLINTLYFKGQWLDEFSKERTEKQDFNLSDGNKISVDMMHLDKGKTYFENDACQIVGLSYSDATMYVILPKGDLDTFFKNTNYETIDGMIDQMSNAQVKIHFPKFKYNNTTPLNDHLINLGMPTSFDDDQADFSKMIAESDYNVFVSEVFQNTAISVDEVGTEAAAVTVITMETTAMPVENPEKDFICDKPFMYIIRENQTASDLFIGIVQNPSK